MPWSCSEIPHFIITDKVFDQTYLAKGFLRLKNKCLCLLYVKAMRCKESARFKRNVRVRNNFFSFGNIAENKVERSVLFIDAFRSENVAVLKNYVRKSASFYIPFGNFQEFVPLFIGYDFFDYICELGCKTGTAPNSITRDSFPIPVYAMNIPVLLEALPQDRV